MSAHDNRVNDTRATTVARTYMDADGTRWRVYEAPFGDYDRRNGMSLIFASESVVRRVRDYPADWAQLPDDALAALSWKV